MRSARVRLYLRVRLSNGRYQFLPPFTNRNQSLRSGYALVNNQPEYHPEGVYYLRYLRGGKRVWEAVGYDADAATVALQNTEHDLQGLALGRLSPTSEMPPNASVSVNEALEEYLAHVRHFRSRKTIAACEQMLTLLGSRLGERTLESLTRKDLLDHISFLQEAGKAPGPCSTIWRELVPFCVRTALPGF